MIREKSAYLAEVSVTEQILWKISKFPEILGELSMCKQCVPGSFLSTHALEPGNEATGHRAREEPRHMYTGSHPCRPDHTPLVTVPGRSRDTDTHVANAVGQITLIKILQAHLS